MDEVVGVDCLIVWLGYKVLDILLRNNVTPLRAWQAENTRQTCDNLACPYKIRIMWYTAEPGFPDTAGAAQ